MDFHSLDPKLAAELAVSNGPGARKLGALLDAALGGLAGVVPGS